jgi:hypothetical protein|tara:strand:- start:64 stop:270 length:207 start_codon:yes stop_codon:yes gene_type:complete
MNDNINLFDKYSGVPTIKLVLKAFYKEVLRRHYFTIFFKNVIMDKLILYQFELIDIQVIKVNISKKNI